jgi:hypothetical protein
VHVDGHLQHGEQQHHDQQGHQHELDDGAAPLAVVGSPEPPLVTEVRALFTAATMAARNGTRMASTSAAASP